MMINKGQYYDQGLLLVTTNSAVTKRFRTELHQLHYSEEFIPDKDISLASM